MKSLAVRLIVAFSCCALFSNARAGNGNALDRLDFGNLTSEPIHNYSPGAAQRGVGVSNQTYRLPPANSPVVFTLGCDSTRQNYLTLRFWGNDAPCQLDLNNPPSQYPSIERDQGPTAIFPNRFYYHTIPIPLTLTSGKTTVALTLKVGSATKRFYSAFTHTAPMFAPDSSDPIGTQPAQTGQTTLDTLTLSEAVSLMQSVRTSVFSGGGSYYNNVLNRQVLPGAAGAPVECVGLDLWNTVSTWGGAGKTPDQWRDQIGGTQHGPGYTTFPDELLSVLVTSFVLPPFTNASGNVVAGLDHYHDTNLLARIVSALDGSTCLQGSDGGFHDEGDPDLNGISGAGFYHGLCSTPRAVGHYRAGETSRGLTWYLSLEGVDTQTLGWSIFNILDDPIGGPIFTNNLAQSFDADLNGGSVLRATAYERLLYNHIQYLQNVTGGTHSQNMFEELGMYAAQVALGKLQSLYPNASYVSSQTTALNIVKEVMGFRPDTLRGVNPSPLTIPNHGFTRNGFGEAHGALSTGFDGGGYGQILPWLAPRFVQFAAWDTNLDATTFSNFVMMAHETINGFDQFLYPQDNATVDANRNLTANTFRFAEERYITYRDPKNPQENSSQFNFNAQFPASDPLGPMTNAFARRSAYLFTQSGLTPITGASAGNGATGGALNYLRDLPAYERTLRALVGVNPAALTPLPGEPGQPDYAWADVQAGAVAVVNQGEQMFMNANWRNYEFNGGFNGMRPSQHARVHFTTTNIERAAMIQLPWNNGTIQSDGNFSSTNLLAPCVVRYGNYLIVLNNSSNTTFNAKLPVGVGQARELIHKTNLYALGSTVPVAAGQSAIFWLAASNSSPLQPGSPTVATLAAASTNVVMNSTVNLSVLGADDGGEANLIYTWALAGTPPNPVMFSVNGNNAAKNTTATFSAAGTYSFVVIIQDAGGLTTNSSVTITVNQTISGLSLSPASAVLLSGQSQQFSAIVLDQFGIPMANALPLTWFVFSGMGKVSANGFYTAPVGAGGSATVRVSSGALSANASVTVAGPIGIFSGSLDIGSPTPAGSSACNSNATTYTNEAGGSDIWGTSDQFRFICSPLAGDATLTARVATQPNTDPWSKCGVMFRNALDANSANAFMCITPANGGNFQWRTTSGASTSQAKSNGLTAPMWVRLTRAGDVFAAFYSTNGTTWFPLGAAQTVAMNDTIYVGLALTSHNSGSLNTSTFDNVSITDSMTVPTGLNATPGDGQVTLGWSGSAVATSYNVKRSPVSGGPYALIGTTASTGFTDLSVTNDTTYFYVVSAVNFVRETTNSAQVNVTPGATPVVTTRGNLIVNVHPSDLAGGTVTIWTNRTSYSNAVGNFAVLGGGPIVVTNVSGLTALSVNGSASRAVISATNVPAEIAGNGTISAEAWVYGQSFLGGQSGVLGYGTNNPNNSDRQFLAFGINAGNNFKAFAGQFNDMSYAMTNVFTLNAWHLISWTYDGTSRLLSVYVDGVFNKSQTMNSMVVPQVPIGVGGVWRAGGIFEAFPGCLGAVRVMSGLLSATDVANNFAAGLLAVATPTKPAGLTAVAGDAKVTLTWNAATNATSYLLKRSTISGGPYPIIQSNLSSLAFTNAGLSKGTRYYFVVSASNFAGESANSTEASAQPVSTQSPPLMWDVSGGQIQLNWPVENTGWRLEAQTNSLSAGLGTNWATVPGSTLVNQISIPIGASNDSVFFRLIYP